MLSELDAYGKKNLLWNCAYAYICLYSTTGHCTETIKDEAGWALGGWIARAVRRQLLICGATYTSSHKATSDCSTDDSL